MDTDCIIKNEPDIEMDTAHYPNASNYDIRVDIEDIKPDMITLPTVGNICCNCLNCGVDVSRRRKHKLNLIEVQCVIKQWVAPLEVTNESVICHVCWTIALNESNTELPTETSTSSGHHRRLCIICGISLLRRRCHSAQDTRIKDMVVESIKPRQLKESDQVCHPCWLRFDRIAKNNSGQRNDEISQNSEVSVTSPPTSEPLIRLPNIKRAADTQARCFFPGCDSTERLSVPKLLRVMIFTDYKYYVPNTCRICSFHLQSDNWQELESIPDPIHDFTPRYIEDFATFVNELF